MNGVNYNDQSLKNNADYQAFLQSNPGRGTLMVRATSVNEALPVKNVRVIVSKVISNIKVIFFDGLTDESGMIKNIELPTPAKMSNDEVIPECAIYVLEALYKPQNLDKLYNIHIYPGISSLQSINIKPNINLETGDNSGS